MSEHSVKIIEIEQVLPHGNADKLEIIPIGGWQAVVKKGQFSVGDWAIYIEPDYLVPTDRAEFAFLANEGKTHHRLKAVRLRGELSYGLLIPVPEYLRDRAHRSDVMDDLGIDRYEPPVQSMGTSARELSLEESPPVFSPKFDIESYQKYPTVIKSGEMVVITEKIHGANARYCFVDGKFFMGSRNRWIDPNGIHPWSVAANNDSRIREWCERNPGVVLYGEVFGAVQSLRYGRKDGEISFAAFAAIKDGKWIDTIGLHYDETLPTVPLIYIGPFDECVFSLAEENTCVYGAEKSHMKEGIVIVPKKERWHGVLGRVALKHISNRYWESNA